ncbi:Putative glycoside hydrolase family 38 domain, galactose mutarotase-like domain superfamily [Septoria linicola]|uniref:Alpha-mannosidase n=1 Tax=Septoria linicola TaxID=215465 RepID=A0A9Q9AYM9_9PEZI|nr:Putative glycoside hydrolase family 38 domain, galactose mutarotase-like domain superfamily [Septoria linicola]
MGGETQPTSNSMASSAAKYPQLAARPKGKLIHDIYRDRLNQFTSNGQYKEQGLLARLYNGRLGEGHVHLSVWSAPDLSRPTFAEATDSKNTYKPTKKGESFGPSWSTHWFRVAFTVPREWKDHERIELHWDSSSEGLVWTQDGKPLQGLTGNGERIEWIVPNKYQTGGEEVIYIEMACNGMFGNPTGGDTIQPPDPNRYFPLQLADLVSVNLDARALFYDFWILGDAAREFPTDSWEEHRALTLANEVIDTFIAGNGSREAIKMCRKLAAQYVGDKVDGPEVYDLTAEDPLREVLVSGIGHCHIDTCWLWPWAETKRKVARSWSNQCDLLDRYPEHRFCASQAQQYKWLEQLYPYAYDRVKEHVKKGTFQPIGGSWVEHDTNMPSGESLVRQFLYGQRYFESRFGERCKTFWLPDTFGYSSQIPQLCRLAGMNRFFTQKLSWNNINNFPHTTFSWVSLDGSQVLCHMAPSETYTAEAHFGDVKRSVTQHKSMDQDPTSLLVFGKGDGGGGPTWGHIEKLRRCRGIADNVGLLPRVHMGWSVEDFFDRLEKNAATGKTEFVTWYGELYFELHRGTYTTQANNKKGNRKSEVLLHDLEYLATMATLHDKKYKYPKKEIDSMWESVLLCQFHDCLPGSSIEMCYDDSDKEYAKVFETGKKVLKDALKTLGFKDDDSSDCAAPPVAINTLGWQRHAKILPSVERSQVSQLPAVVGQQEERPRGWGWCAKAATVTETGDGAFVLQNEKLAITVADGVITSLYDKAAEREVLPKGGKANQLVLFDDKPLYWQAWDVEVFHLESRQELKATGKTEITEQSGHRVAVTTKTQISQESWIKTTIALSATTHPDETSYVEVDAEVEWHETMKFLKVEFPTTITNTEASYETQFGIVRRPTHYNTTWDMAKFEVCCHKWADLSEHGYGVSILNDSKYGFATTGKLMRLSLLRAPKAPDAHADMGRHHMKWAVLPHSGPLDERTVRAAAEFNNPMTLHKHSDVKSIESLFTAFKLTPNSSPSLVIDTIKRGEDDEDASNGDLPAKEGRHVIVRVYDSLGGTSRGTIALGPVKVHKVWKTNILEDEGEEVEVGKEGVMIELRAFEVATYKLLVGW